jgi:murein DD-endopeptidase MepM/ murein hydrolase activator NlpD
MDIRRFYLFRPQQVRRRPKAVPNVRMARHAVMSVLIAGIAACALGPTAPSPRSWICNPSAATARATLEMFRAPFDGDAPVGNFFDHDKPVDADPSARIVTLCGVSVHGQVNGHPGYDYSMPEGTVLRAVAGGTIFFAGLEAPRPCPQLNRTVQAEVVEIQHTAPDGSTLISVYGHLSRIDVVTGQSIGDGDAIGLSGNTGCSGTPHLHFGVYRKMSADSYTVIDPYGWHANTDDPWELDPRGAKSIWLWRPGQAPILSR